MQPKIEQMVKDAIQPHLQPLLDKQVILEETVSQLQNNNAKSWMTFSAMVGMIDEMKSGLLRVAETTSES
jgi:hypothetical protein